MTPANEATASDAASHRSDPSGPLHAWRALTLLLCAALYPALLTWAYYVALEGWPTHVKQATYIVGKALQFALPLLSVLFFRRSRAHAEERMAPVAVPPQCRMSLGTDLFVGLASGIVICAAMLAGYFLIAKPFGMMPIAAHLGDKLRGFGIASGGSFFLLGVFYCVAHSGLEEYYWRWFVFGELRRWLPGGERASRVSSMREGAAPHTPMLAIGLSSLAFTIHHYVILAHFFGLFAPVTWLFALGVFTGGVIWAWHYQRSGSLLGPWLSHALADLAIFIVGWSLLAAQLSGG